MKYSFIKQLLPGIVLVVSAFVTAQSLITSHEWNELGVSDVIATCNRSVTRFGLKGLQTLTIPTTDRDQLKLSQERIRLLIASDRIQNRITELLSGIASVQNVMNGYVAQKNPLHASAQKFYFKVPYVKEYLNNNKYALTCWYVYQATSAGQKLLKKLFLYGLIKEWWSWVYADDDAVFDVKRGLIDKGIGDVISRHQWKSTIDDLETYKFKHYCNAYFSGTIKDKYTVLNKGYDYSDISFVQSLANRFEFDVPVAKMNAPLAFGIASFVTLTADCYLAYEAYKAGKSFLSITRLVKILQHRCVKIAHFFNTVKELTLVLDVIGHPYQELADQMMAILEKKEVRKCIALSQSNTFSSESKYYLFSYGNVLKLHHTMKQIQDELLDLFEQIGLVDGYVSLARLYQESQDTMYPYTFVEFIENETPVIDVCGAWLPTITKNGVCNDVFCGQPFGFTNTIITGPNGGGKSVYEKLQGLMVVLAQSWGMVPAQSARLTVFDKVYTALNPQEDLSKGLSKFMAQKLRMAELEDAIMHADQSHKVLVLADEPYSGTVDDEAAKRICDFMFAVSQNPYACVTIATHAEQPIKLEPITNGICKNFHVGIIPNKDGSFTRTFKLQEGVAHWWFDDQVYRSKYIDWIAQYLYGHA